MCAPLTPPATYTPKVTAIAHPQVISNQSPLATKIAVPRPDWLSAATAIATTPSPKQMSTKVPRNSADISPPLSSRAIWTLGYLLGQGAGWPANAGEGEWTMHQRLLRPGGRSISSDDTLNARCPCSLQGPFGGVPPSLAAR